MTRRRADLLLITAAAVWGVSFVVVKEALTAASPLLFVAARFAIAMLVLAPLVNLRAGFSRGELRAGAVLTTLLASGFGTQAYGLQFTTPARSAFIVAMSSVLAPVIALVLLRHRSSWMVWLALLAAGVGIYFLTAPDAGGLNRGDLWTLITSVVFGGHIVAVSEFSRRFDAQRLVWLQLPGTAIGALSAALLVEQLRFEWSVGLVAALLFLSVMSTVIALIWQFRAQRVMSSARAS
ncbi:MAG TPA: DMT family transporter, partial [Gemmatimonadales bacterium]|nr:DMT family transporter [Gemmatimonadales bacterium]